MNIKQNLSILFLVIGTLLLAACSKTTSSSPQPDKNVNDPIPLESSNASETKLIASDGANSDLFGTSVFINGDAAIVGAEFDDDNGANSGSAYIFTFSDTSWDQQAKLTASDGTANALFGHSVSISGDTAIVGAKLDDNGIRSGSAYIFTRSGTSWGQQAKLTASDRAVDDHFGHSVSISGNTVIIGAWNDDDKGTNSGSAYIFIRSGTQWSQQAKLTANDGVGYDFFGGSVLINGDNAIVGADLDDDNGKSSGSAYIFTRSGTSWNQQAKLIPNDAAAYDHFGSSVSISGDAAIVGNRQDDDNGNNSGSAYVFTRSGTSWSQQAKLIASDGAANDFFGNSVSISGNNAIVGADSNDENGTDFGSAYVFTRSGTSWSQESKLTASDGAANDFFGRSVSISGNTAIVGTPHDEDNGDSSGSAYVYKLTSEEPPEITTIYVSSNSSGNTGNISFKDEDILAFDTNTNSWSLYFDGSDVGLAASDLNAFHLQPDGSLLLSLEQSSFSIPNFGTVRASDIVRFIPISLGNNTQGSFEWYFDGSDVGLSSAEGIDAIGFTTDGDLLVSMIIGFNVPSVSGGDEDLLAFSADSLGKTTAGTWSLYFDGSDVHLNDSFEDIYGVWLNPSNSNLYLTTYRQFSVTGLSGDADDVFTFTPNTLGDSTNGSFSAFWNGDQNDFVNEGMDGLFLQ